MIADATQSYAALGKFVGLSAPAVFERVRRLRQAGVISATVARLDGAKAGKPLLAFIHVDCEGWGKGPRMMRLSAFPEVEEMHSVAGDTAVILKVRTANTHALEALLAQIYALPGVK
ncbi:MAG: Lrp/AsnC family transcriptional regulator, partial [Asticcacaulis sp.]|nr:Lrp/AsnC family transcriptional regulator [Asticcacaulis sp.]